MSTYMQLRIAYASTFDIIQLAAAFLLCHSFVGSLIQYLAQASGKELLIIYFISQFRANLKTTKKMSVFLFSIAIGETNGNKIQYVFFFLLVSKLQTIPMRLQSAKRWPTRKFLRPQFDLISLYLQRLEKLAGKMCGDDVIDFRRYV